MSEPVRKNEAAAGRRLTYQSVTSAMNSIGTVWVFVLLVIINLDIGGRAIFNHPIRGVPEVVSMGIVALVFIQLAHTLSVGRLTRSEVLIGWLIRARPRLGNVVDGIFHLVGATLMVILFIATLPMFTKAWQINEYVGAEGDFKAPIWPVRLIVLIGCVATCIEFILLAWQDFRNTRRPAVIPGE